MTKRLRSLLQTATEQKVELDRRAANEGGFAYALASRSMATHIDDLSQQIALLDDRSVIEIVELRLKAPQFRDGSAPLRLIAKASEDFRQLIGYAALRLTRGGLGKKRVPNVLYEELDLRLAALLPGSSRMVITTSSNRDLLDDGLAKGALARFFRVLESDGQGEEFLESVTDLGPQSSRHVRNLIDLVQNESAEVAISWRYGGELVRQWEGTKESLEKVSFALAVTEVNSKNEVVLQGVVELLSKRERIYLHTDYGETVRILFPKRLLPSVAELHLDQTVRLRCAVTETTNPFTGESSTFHELLGVVS
jgi:hypothetical protein